MKKILWLDDEEDLIDDSAPVFKKYGFEVVKAITPTQALRLLREKKGELSGVLLDVILGLQENGIELLKELRHLHPGIKVVIFTGHPDYSDHVDSEMAGALAYFEKIDKSIPLDPDKQRGFFNVLHDLFPDVKRSPASVGKRVGRIRSEDQSLLVRGFFFLVAFVILAAVLGVLSNNISIWRLPLVLVVILVAYFIMCLVIIQTQPRPGLSNEGFVTLMKEALSLMPKLLSFGKQNREDDEAESESSKEKN